MKGLNSEQIPFPGAVKNMIPLYKLNSTDQPLSSPNNYPQHIVLKHVYLSEKLENMGADLKILSRQELHAPVIMED
jgi:hypothetical protein